MAWDEWEQLKADAASRQSTGMQLNQLDPGDGSFSPVPGQTGDLKVGHDDLAKIGSQAHTLFDDLHRKARVAGPSSDKAAGDLSGQGFALGGGLKHVSNRWGEQLKSLMDACAHISNHMQVTKNVHAGDEHYIQGQLSSLTVLDDGFDERVGEPGKKNPVYEPKK